jgi:hypothetical protein
MQQDLSYNDAVDPEKNGYFKTETLRRSGGFDERLR